MIVNYKSIDNQINDSELQEIAERLMNIPWRNPGQINAHESPDGMKSYYTVDVIGEELRWMNDTFPKEQFTWYLWFESVFLVPEEMVTFLKLRWG